LSAPLAWQPAISTFSVPYYNTTDPEKRGSYPDLHDKVAIIEVMIDIPRISRNLTLGHDGIWSCPRINPIHYPDEGYSNCFEVEESSFWVHHRNSCLIHTIREFPPDGPILDIGGGNGYVSLHLNECGFETILVEPGVAAVRNARLRGVKQIIRASFEEAGFKDNSIPAVGIFDVLEHIEDDCAFLEALKRVLIPEGKVYLTVPAIPSLWSKEDDHTNHFRRYTLRGIEEKLQNAGFTVEYATYFFIYLILPIFILRIIPTRLGLFSRSTPEKVRHEHLSQKPILNTLISLFLKVELVFIKRKKKVPFGSSCLVVASATHNGNHGH